MKKKNLANVPGFHELLADMYDRLAARMVVALYHERDVAVRELGIFREDKTKTRSKRAKKNKK